MKQTKPETNEGPARLSVVLQNPSAEWSEIRAAMKAQGGGCTNLAIVSALSSKGGGSNDNYSSNNNKSPMPMQPGTNKEAASGEDEKVAAEEVDVASARKGSGSGGDDKLMPLCNRRGSLASQDSSSTSSSSRPSLRGIRRQSSRRRAFRSGSRRFLLHSSVNTSIRSITLDSLNESSSSLNNSSNDFNNSSFKDSVNIMDFGVSHQRGLRAALDDSVNLMDFGVSQRRLMAAALDASDRSCTSLDDGALNDMKEELDEGVLLKEKSRRELLVSWRHDSTMSGLDESIRSEGDLNSYVDSCGFLDWPSVAAAEGEEEIGIDDIETGEDAIQEESLKEVQQEEEWNIEDYEGGDDSDQGRMPRTNSISTSALAVANTFKKFAIPRRASNSSSTSSKEDFDLLKIKEALPTLIAKNRQQQSTEVDGSSGKKKRAGSMSLLGMFQQSLDAEVKKDTKAKADDEVTRRKSRKEVIWAKDSVNIGCSDEYKKLYAPAPKKAPQRKSWNIFEGVKSNVDDFSERRSST
mmetsp:Transcript_14188/g.24122  ORF Transcript_14188/g.24122 Transcript_14188/m.24122 type:complete len:522 (+) Transcript_14188:119-1684(+)